MGKFLICLIFLYSNAYDQYIGANINIIKKSKEIYFSGKRPFSANENKEKRPDASENFNVRYYRCQWKTDPAVRYIEGIVSSFFIITIDASFIVYDLSDSLKVDSVKERNNFLSFSHHDNRLKINFNNPVSKGTFDSVTIFYQGVPPKTGFGSFINSTHDNIPVMWTLSEPYGSRDWWPCKN